VPGARENRVLFNDRYEAAQTEIYRRGVIGLAYSEEERESPHPHLISFVMGYLLSHGDISTHCPVTLTGAVAYVVSEYGAPGVRERFLNDSTRMDGLAKTGGTWATERHSGSDIARTAATARLQGDGTFRLYGQKWFASNAASGLAVATARLEGPDGAAAEGGKGLGLYLVPSHLPDGRPNAYRVTALKEKMGTKGLATAELELNGCAAYELAPPPHGLRVMMEALGYSRVHNAMAAAGAAHRAFIEATAWARTRETFGRPLESRPMIRRKIIGLRVDHLAACALAFESAALFGGPDKTLSRFVTAIAKHATAAIAVRSAQTLIELIGGNGYTEDFPASRLLRDAMVLPVWEGPEQIQALELLRLIMAAPENAPSFLKYISALLEAFPESLGTEKSALAQSLARLTADLTTLAGRPQDGESVADRLLAWLGTLLTAALVGRDAATEGAIKETALRHFLSRQSHPAGGLFTDTDRLDADFSVLAG